MNYSTRLKQHGGSATPVIRDVAHTLSHSCKTEKGGDKNVKSPKYKLQVRNPVGNKFL